MATMYVRNAQGNFEKIGIGGVTVDTTLSMAGKPADASAVGIALANCAPASGVSERVYYEKATGLTDEAEIEADLEAKANEHIINIYNTMLNQTTKRVVAIEDGNVWFWDIFRGAEDFGCVMAYKYGAYGIPSVRGKNIYGSVVHPWAYQTPPTKVGIEYCTMELWNGKPVYVKVLDCGTLPGAKQEEFINLGSTGIVDSIIDMQLTIKSASNNRQYIYPLHSDDSGLFQTTLYFDGVNQRIRVYCLSDQSTKTGMLTVKYTKL